MKVWWIIHRDDGSFARVQGPKEQTESEFYEDRNSFESFEEARQAIVDDLESDIDHLTSHLAWVKKQKESWGKHDGPEGD